jgi:hypothetical protein
MRIKKTNIQANPVTPVSWILTDEENTRIGLMTASDDVFRVIMPTGKQEFSSIKDLEKACGWKITFISKTDDAEPTNQLNGLPVKHSAVFNTEEKPFVSYTRISTSQVRFAAGYWGIRFAHIWSGSLCPKVQTLAENQHIGPFSTKLELNTFLAQKNSKQGKNP